MTTTTSDTSDAEALRVFFDRMAGTLRTSTPCVVVAFDGDGKTVDVQPTIAMTRRVDGVQSVPLPIIRGVPILMYGSTKLGLFVCPPLGPGDEGWLMVSDSALDNWQYGNQGQIASPPDAESPRHHDITDVVFFPGAQRMDGDIADYPDTAIQLRNRDGTTVVSLDETSIETKVVGGAGMRQEGTLTSFDGNMFVDGNLSLSGVGGGNMTLSGSVTITDSLTVGGNVVVTGTVTASGFIDT